LYDINSFLEDLKLSEEDKEKLILEVRDEFPDDEMLFELHLYRIVQHLKKTLKDTDI
jgi:hypothetical protein